MALREKLVKVAIKIPAQIQTKKEKTQFDVKPLKQEPLQSGLGEQTC